MSAVFVESVKTWMGVLAHTKLCIIAVALYRTRAFFSLANNLHSVFIASVSQAEIEENLCAEPDITLQCDVRN